MTTLSPAELVDVYDTRLLLEREATRLGSARLDRAAGEQMRRQHSRMREAVEAGQRAEALDSDEKLLTILYVASGNAVLVDLIHSLWQRCRPYKLVGIEGAATHADPAVWSFQGPLIDAAAHHDVSAAVAITERSLISATARIKSMLDGG